MNNVCSRLSSRVNLLRMTYGISDSDSVCSCALYTHTIINLMDMKCVTMSTTFVYSERMAKRDFIRSKFTYDNYYLREVTVETMASIQNRASNRWRWQQRWRARREKRYSPLSDWQIDSMTRWLKLRQCIGNCNDEWSIVPFSGTLIDSILLCFVYSVYLSIFV